MQQQLLLFGAPGDLNTVAGELRGTVCDRLVSLFETLRDQHILVEWPVDHDHLLPIAGQDAAPSGDVIGVVIAALHPNQLGYPEPTAIQHRARNQVVKLDPVPSPVTTDYIIQLRVLAGVSQAMVDFEVVRLAVRPYGLDLGPGRLWLVEHDDER